MNRKRCFEQLFSSENICLKPHGVSQPQKRNSRHGNVQKASNSGVTRA